MTSNLADIIESIDTVNNYQLDNAVIEVLNLCKNYIIDQTDEITALESEIDLICQQADKNLVQLPIILRLNYPERFKNETNN